MLFLGGGKMADKSEHATESLTYHYQEMVRLSNGVDAAVKDIFGDFKLLAAVGGILSWKPIHDAFQLGGPNDSSLLFIGFVAIIFFLAIAGVMNLQRQLLVNFNIEQIRQYELEVRTLLGNKDARTFRNAENWQTGASSKLVLVSLIFNLHFYAAILMPVFLLEFDPYGWIYLIIAVVAIMLNTLTLYIVHGDTIKSFRLQNDVIGE